jgi:serine/threonine-protein kinase
VTTGTNYSGLLLEGRYQVVKRLGHGGMGAVYLGHHLVLDRHVAIKFLHKDLVQDEDTVRRFYREARAAAAIRHPSIIEVMDVGTSPEGEPFLVMEYLEGESLGAMLARTGIIDISLAAEILDPAMDALAAAHDRGIVHRDLKPDNIFLVDLGRQSTGVKLIDFGISKFTRSEDKTNLTKVGTVLGTPAYMSPEQIRGSKEVDQRTDIYALGVILYEMLTRKLPFAGDNYMQVMDRVLTEEALPPSAMSTRVKPEIDAVVMRALAKHPEERFQKVDEMRAALRLAAADGGRQPRLSMVMTGIAKRSFAGGFLGDDARADSTGLVDVESQRRRARFETPEKWGGTAGPSRKPLGLYAVLVGLGAAAAVGIVLLVLLSGGSGGDAAGNAPAQAGEARGDHVNITIEGQPEGARILYDGMQVPMNPFPVRKGAAIVPVEVRAAGYETLRIGVLPSEDRVLTIALEPLAGTQVPKTGPEPAKTASTPPPEKKPEPAAVAEAPPPEKKPEPVKTSQVPSTEKKSEPAKAALQDSPYSTGDGSGSGSGSKKKPAMKKKGSGGEFATAFE